jgi:hypothetical protein
MKMNVWKIIDGAIIISIIFLFIAGRALGTTMTGVVDFTTSTLTVTGGNISAGGSIGSEPQAAILMFDKSCPTGWTRQTQFDNAIPYGAAAYSATPGGSATHTHGVDAHTHTEGFGADDGGSHSHAQGANALTDDPGSHTHTQPGDAGCDDGVDNVGACAGISTGSGGAHSHTVDFDANTGATAHSHTVSGSIDSDVDTLDSTTSIPAYARLVFCRKN